MAKFLTLVVGTLISVQLASGQETAPKSLTIAPSEIKRLALVIGVENYDHAERVPNAIRDGSDINQKLKEAGFTVVRFVADPQDDNTILDYVQELADLAGDPSEPAILLFYFSGHGFQNGGWPSIVPKGARKDLYTQDSVSLDRIFATLTQHQAGLSIFLLDACRTGLAVDKSHLPLNQDDLTRKKLQLSALDSRQMAVLDLSTELGEPAHSMIHAGETHSPFTYGLIAKIAQPQKDLERVFEDVRTYVAIKSGDSQSSVIVADANLSRFFLLPSAAQIQLQDETWSAVVKTGRYDCAKAYKLDHPGSHNLKNVIDLMNSGTLTQQRDGNEECPDD